MGKRKELLKKINEDIKKEKGMMEVLREEEKGGGTRLWSYLNVVPDSKEMEHYLVSISVLYMITCNTQYSANIIIFLFFMSTE